MAKDIQNRLQREAFLKDNCDAVEEKGYMKPFKAEQLQGHKEKLAETSIKIEEIEEELKEIKKDFNDRLKDLKEERSEIIRNIKMKAEFVSEICYKFIDQEARKVGYYNAEGDLIEERPATADEMQPTLFMQPKTGTYE
ncbi:MAG: hypothetical protein PUG96_02545 [Prevotellaceae bacterium]|nr:hypothetical protein [Prevotellaceae bacterium]